MKCYKDDTITVPKHLEINMDKLKSYLNWALKLHSKGKQIHNIWHEFVSFNFSEF
jgi:hypothetical protein